MDRRNRDGSGRRDLPKPNPHFDFEASPFYVNTRAQDWKSPAGTPRRAAISSFSLTNAHLVLEEYLPDGSRREGIGTVGVMPCADPGRGSTGLHDPYDIDP